MKCPHCKSSIKSGETRCSSCHKDLPPPISPKDQQMDLLLKTGDQINDRYILQNYYGETPLTHMFVAIDNTTHTPVKFSLLKSGVISTPEQWQLMEQVLREEKFREHDNLEQVYDYGVQDQLYYYVSEYLDGIPLSQVIELRKEQNRSFALMEIEPIINQITQGLQEIHEDSYHGLLHAQNIIILSDQIKLENHFWCRCFGYKTVFGVKQFKEENLLYLAPETQPFPDQEPDQTADLYALGVLLSHLLTGKIYDGTPYNLTSFATQLPQKINEIFGSLTAKNQKERYQHILYFIDDFQELFDDVVDPDANESTRVVSEAEMHAIQHEHDFDDEVDTQMHQPKSPPTIPPTPPGTPPPPPTFDEDEIDTHMIPPSAPKNFAEDEIETTMNEITPPVITRDPASFSGITSTSGQWKNNWSQQNAPQKNPFVDNPSPTSPVHSKGDRNKTLLISILFVMLVIALGTSIVIIVRLVNKNNPSKKDIAGGSPEVIQYTDKTDNAHLPHRGTVTKVVPAKVVPTKVTPIPTVKKVDPPPKKIIKKVAIKPVKTIKTVKKVDPVIKSKPVIKRSVTKKPVTKIVKKVDKPIKKQPIKITPPKDNTSLLDLSQDPKAVAIAPTVIKNDKCPRGMNKIKSGPFTYGSSKGDSFRGAREPLAHKVTLKTYCIDKFESGRGTSFNQAVKICAKKGKRVCTTQEWEKGCKGPFGYRYPYGNTFNVDRCNSADDEGEPRSPAKGAQFKKCRSIYGLYDMSGNFEEWTVDGKRAILKGGSFKSEDYDVRCAGVKPKSKSYRSSTTGVRCCKDLN